MQTKQINNYTFVNESGNNNNGCYHKTTLLKNGVQIFSHKTNYLNRTLESYIYKSSMQNTINELINIYSNQIILQYRKNNPLTKRLKSITKDYLISSNDYIKELNNLLKNL